MQAYSQSKLACLMFALELQRRSIAAGWRIKSIAAPSRHFAYRSIAQRRRRMERPGYGSSLRVVSVSVGTARRVTDSLRRDFAAGSRRCLLRPGQVRRNARLSGRCQNSSVSTGCERRFQALDRVGRTYWRGFSVKRSCTDMSSMHLMAGSPSTISPEGRTAVSGRPESGDRTRRWSLALGQCKKRNRTHSGRPEADFERRLCEDELPLMAAGIPQSTALRMQKFRTPRTHPQMRSRSWKRCIQ